MNKIRFWTLIWMATATFSSFYAQEYKLTGTIIDTLNNPLENANILAIPLSTDYQIKFSIADSDGRFELRLKENQTYNVEISYLGYQKYIDTLSLSQDIIKNYALNRSNQNLDEIIIVEHIPVKIREDTITYRVDKFVDGRERKLRDVLKKLPGIDIDRDGNVQVNGKDVTKLLVDGKEFFTGDEKLGVNNIPADVIDEVVALDNYNSVSFLKGLSDSEQLALNIKLKKGRKKFYFGDLEGGGGIESRFLIHPALFYYSPKTSVNLIGDFNNVGEKAFTVKDYIDFEGGFDLMDGENSNYFSLLNDEFSQFLQQKDFVFNRNNFGAFSLSQDITDKTSLNVYSIISANTLESRVENNLDYLNGFSPDESRISTQKDDLVFSINKVQLRYIGATNLDIKYEGFLKTNDAKAITHLNSQTILDTTVVKTKSEPNNIDFTHKISIDKQFNGKHTSSFTTSHKITRNKKINDYQFNQPVFSNQIPFVDENSDFFNLNQITENRINDLKLHLKHYWVLHSYHHLYTEVGINILNQQYNTLDRQLLDTGENSFFNNGFNNNVLVHDKNTIH